MTDSASHKSIEDFLSEAPAEGDPGSMELYLELRNLARRAISNHPYQTLNTTAIVHEAWLKLQSRDVEWNSREHFVGTAALAMRQILVDYARYRTADMRDHRKQVEIFEVDGGESATAEQMLALDQALTSLEKLDEKMTRLVMLRFFAGLGLDEAAACLEVSPRTASRLWTRARAFLKTNLNS
jgi:RNA polymerase sigma-70 factor, ECF subfamily